MLGKGKPFLFEWREALLSEHGPKDPYERYVALVISLFSDCDGGNCYPSQNTLAAMCHMGLNTVNRKIRDAKRHGWITVSKAGLGGQGWKRAEYHLTIPRAVKRKLSECQDKGIATTAIPLFEGSENIDLTHPIPGKCNTINSLREGIATERTPKGIATTAIPLFEGSENIDLAHHSPGKCNTIKSLQEGIAPGDKKVLPQRHTTSPIDLPIRKAFSDKSEKAPAGGRRPSSQTSKSHFSAKAGDYLSGIQAACQKISALPQKKKTFNVYQWVQHQANSQKHPGAIQESLQGLIALWNEIESPWAYADAIMKTKNGNYNERDAIAEAAKFKSEWAVNEKVRDLIGEVGRSMPGGPKKQYTL